jgi:hypothetical protein
MDLVRVSGHTIIAAKPERREVFSAILHQQRQPLGRVV